MIVPLVIILALLVPGTAAAQDKPSAPAESGRWIVVYDRAAVTSVDRETDALEQRRGFRSRLRFRRAIEGFAARLTPEQVRALRADPDVEAVVPDRPVRARALRPVAANEIVPTGIVRAGLGRPEAVHDAADSGVAVVDTGVDLQHPDLNVADGTNCVTPGAPADDVDGHGTHVAGTVAAENDGLGVVGAAPGTRIHAVKALNDEGEGAVSQIVCGIDWVVANAAARGIRVINMSLGTLGDNNRNCGVRSSDGAFVDPLHAAICRATAAGILSVVAAGNGDPVTGIGWNMSESPPDVPATYPEVLTVTAMADGDGIEGGRSAVRPDCGDGETDDSAATFSNFTTVPEEAAHTIAAPGVCILSTLPLEQGGYRSLSGTSMAAPHVAGWAALCLGEAGVPGPCAGMSPAQIVERLRTDAALFRGARPEAGFSGDPAAPIGSRFYGFLLRPPGPDTTLTAAPPAVSSDTTPTFALSSPGPGARFECNLDGGAWSACGPQHTTAPLPDGQHVFAARAVDQLGNPDTSPATAAFTVDTTRPRVSYSVASRQRIATVSRKGMRVSVNCTEACRLAASVVVSGRVAGTKNGGLATGRRVLTIRLKSTVRRRLARTRGALVQLRLTATDAAGNARAVKKSVRLVR